MLLWHAASEKEAILDAITAFASPIMLSPSSITLYTPAVLLDDCTCSICISLLLLLFVLVVQIAPAASSF